MGYPRIGANRELKTACENYWAGKASRGDLQEAGKKLRSANWQIQKESGLDVVPSNDFSFYDQVLDRTFSLGAIPDRYLPLIDSGESDLDVYFAMARGYQKNGLSITAMEMTKWFDTNYHYIVPEFHKNQCFELRNSKILDEFNEAKSLGIVTKPVIIGPVSFLLLGKEKGSGFDKLDLLDNLLPIYIETIRRLTEAGANWIEFDEPFLAMDLTHSQAEALARAYSEISDHTVGVKLLVATYFEGLRDNLQLAAGLPVDALHIDLVRAPNQLDDVLGAIPSSMFLSLGVVDGRNVWKNDFSKSLSIIETAVDRIGFSRLMIAPSCSLLHSPVDLDSESNAVVLPAEVKSWLSFARQKVREVAALRELATNQDGNFRCKTLKENCSALDSRLASPLTHDKQLRIRIESLTDEESNRKSKFEVRREKQQKTMKLPAFPATTIGSFPQTPEIRRIRAKLRKGEASHEDYDAFIREEIKRTVKWQEEIGLDVLVHGEYERNDMVEYFGEKLKGFVFTQNGWVQSYGSRCVKPPIIVGDVSRPKPMTVCWTSFAQSLTQRPVKGMLTGPATMLQWSFVRDDQPRSETCLQIALAIRDEVSDLEKAGIRVIQIDEPAFREGLPLRNGDRREYLRWAVRAFRIASSSVADETQIHTHMCYSEFNDIIDSIAQLDADVITVECSRSQMELLTAFATYHYPNDIGPGVFDIHSPRIPSENEMANLLSKAADVIPSRQLWVNPDCGLKTRKWEEIEPALKSMVNAAQTLRVNQHQ